MCIDDCRGSLTKDYNLFGYVVDGIEIAKAIEVDDLMQKVEIAECERGSTRD